MNRNHREVTKGSGDRNVKIKGFIKYSAVAENEELIAFAIKNSYWTTIICVLVFSVILFFLDIGVLFLFVFNMIVALIGFIWNYKYNSLKKPVLIINKTGITNKKTQYQWRDIKDMICAEAYDEETDIYYSTYVKFNYMNSVKTVHIAGLSRPVDEIIHYINAHQKRNNKLSI